MAVSGYNFTPEDIDLFNPDKWVLDNQIPEVETGGLFTQKSSDPEEKGLLSYTIFGGPGSIERKVNWGHINLVNYFVHPHVLYELKRYQANYGVLVNGNEDFFVNPVDGKITMVTDKTPVPKGCEHGTGVRFLYKVWDKINFDPKTATADDTKMRLMLFSSLKKNEVFMSKLPVCPAFYRDMSNKNDKISEINILYRKILNNANALKSTSGMLEIFGTTSSDRKIQDLLLELYNYFVNIFGGTKGFIHKNIMGKATDYSARAVASMPIMDDKSHDTVEVSFSHSAIPLSTVSKAFAPFIKYGLKQLINAILLGSHFMNILDPKTHTIVREEIAPDFMDDFNTDAIDKLLDLYESSYQYRMEPFLIRLKNGKKVPLYFFNHKREAVTHEQAAEEIKTNAHYKMTAMTLCEALYIAAYTTCKDKCVYITRYPLEDQHNIYPSLINIVPCTKTEKRTVLGVEFPRWPVLPDDRSRAKDLNYLFVDTVRIFPTYLKALGCDFDGDQLSIQGVFTEEANISCKKYIYSKMNILDMMGGTMRELPEISQVGLFNLTYRYTV